MVQAALAMTNEAGVNRAPVWVWLPNQAHAVRCGSFSWVPGRGTFAYDAEYRSLPGALPLDPVSLPLLRSAEPIAEERNAGLFGVLRDAALEGFGHYFFEHVRQTSLRSPLQRLTHSPDDAVGAVHVGDVAAQDTLPIPPMAEELLAVLSSLEKGRQAAEALLNLPGPPLTGLGGERPKLTVKHKGQLWIAKLQARGDLSHGPLREYLTMRAARECGIDAAEVEFARAGEHEVLFVRRFDRRLSARGDQTRHLFASAHTVLRLHSQLRADSARSYLGFAEAARLWTQSVDHAHSLMKREIWKRMAFNAIVGNGDDHPRNHALVHTDAGWGLAPAFDVAPYARFSGTLAMCSSPGGSSLAKASMLLACSSEFELSCNEARLFIEQYQQTIGRSWHEDLKRLGLPSAEIPPPTFRWLQ